MKTQNDLLIRHMPSIIAKRNKVCEQDSIRIDRSGS